MVDNMKEQTETFSKVIGTGRSQVEVPGRKAFCERGKASPRRTCVRLIFSHNF